MLVSTGISCTNWIALTDRIPRLHADVLVEEDTSSGRSKKLFRLMLVSGRWHGWAKTLYMVVGVGLRWTRQKGYVLEGHVDVPPSTDQCQHSLPF